MNNFIVLGYIRFIDKILGRKSILYIDYEDTSKNLLSVLRPAKLITFNDNMPEYSEFNIKVITTHRRDFNRLVSDIMPRLDKLIYMKTHKYTNFKNNRFNQLLENFI